MRNLILFLLILFTYHASAQCVGCLPLGGPNTTRWNKGHYRIDGNLKLSALGSVLNSGDTVVLILTSDSTVYALDINSISADSNTYSTVTRLSDSISRLNGYIDSLYNTIGSHDSLMKYRDTSDIVATISRLIDSAAAIRSGLTSVINSHVTNYNNPHQVTPAQVGVDTLSAHIRDSLIAHWSQIMSNYAAIQQRTRFSDTTLILGTKAFLLANYYAKGGSTFGANQFLGLLDGFRLDIGNSGTARITIFPSGRIGINTGTDASYQLDVFGNTRFRGIPRFDNASNGNYFELVSNVTNPYIRWFKSGSYDIRLQTLDALPITGSAGLTLTDGSVSYGLSISRLIITAGIGVVLNTSGSATWIIRGSTDNGLQYVQDNVSNRGWCGYASGSATYQVRVNAATGPSDGTLGIAVRSTGFTGLGVLAPTQRLQVAGQVKIDSVLTVTSYDSVLVLEDGVIKSVLFKVSASTTLDFPSTAAGAQSDLTVAIPGASINDIVSIGVPNGSATNGSYFAWVSATNTVTIRYIPVSLNDPASNTFKVYVLK